MTIQTSEQRIKNFEKKQYLVSGFALLIFCGLAVVLNTLHLQSVAEQNTRFLSRMVKIGDFRETSLVLQEARLSNFTMIHYQSALPGKSFILPPKAELFRDDGFWKAIGVDSITVPMNESLSSDHPDKITFEFNRFRLIPYAIFIWIFLNLISIPQTRFIKRRLIEQFNHDLDLERKAAKSEVAQQVRHNLRTPLAALMRIPKKLPDSVSKDRDLLELTIGQIRELIAKLDDKPNEKLSDQSESDLYKTLVQARHELGLYVSKTIDFRFEIDDMVSSTIISHVPFEVRAILGNLVTNSLEAIDARGKILIKAVDAGGEVEVHVIDNGCGIDPKYLNQIFDKSFSHGKANGSGIGLSHARDHMESWGGSIHAESVAGMGTTLILKFPIKERASWYIPRLKFTADSKLYVLDDQEAGRGLWRLKLEDKNLLDRATFLSTGADLATFQDEIQSLPEGCTLLFDYDLGNDETGFEWLEKMPKSATRCLVTGHFDRDDVRAACTRSGVYLIPKSQIPDIPIVVR